MCSCQNDPQKQRHWSDLERNIFFFNKNIVTVFFCSIFNRFIILKYVYYFFAIFKKLIIIKLKRVLTFEDFFPHVYFWKPFSTVTLVSWRSDFFPTLFFFWRCAGSQKVFFPLKYCPQKISTIFSTRILSPKNVDYFFQLWFSDGVPYHNSVAWAAAVAANCLHLYNKRKNLPWKEI